MKDSTKNSLSAFLFLVACTAPIYIPRAKQIAEERRNVFKDLTLEDFNKAKWSNHYVEKGENTWKYFKAENLPNHGADNWAIYQEQIQNYQENKSINVEHLKYGEDISLPDLDGNNEVGLKSDSTKR